MSNNDAPQQPTSSNLTESQDSVGEAVVRQVVTMKSSMGRAAATQLPRVVAHACLEVAGKDTSSIEANISQGVDRSVEAGKRTAEHVVRAMRWAKGKKTE